MRYRWKTSPGFFFPSADGFRFFLRVIRRAGVIHDVSPKSRRPGAVILFVPPRPADPKPAHDVPRLSVQLVHGCGTKTIITRRSRASRTKHRDASLSLRLLSDLRSERRAARFRRLVTEQIDQIR